MTHKELEDQLLDLEQQYASLKNSLEANVTDWRWSRRQYYSAEPFFNEKQNKKVPKLLKSTPTNPAGMVMCGFDVNQRVIVEKEIQSHELHGWDRFYIYDEGLCTWELAFSKEGKMQYGRRYFWEHQLLQYYQHKHLFGDVRFFREEYFYEEGKIRTSILDVDFVGRGDHSRYIYTYIYTADQQLLRITANIEHSYSKGYNDLVIYKNKVVETSA